MKNNGLGEGMCAENENYSEVTISLVRKLKEIYDNDDFIICVLSYVDNEEDQRRVIEFIEAGDDVDDETITVLAMDLCDARENR